LVLPNILVYIDVRQGRPTGPSLYALAEARRAARAGGATVFGVVATLPLDTTQLAALAGPIGAAGADKLLLCEGEDLGAPPTDATHGRVLDAAGSRVPAALVLLPAGGPGTALGPPLAARLGGPYVPWCELVLSDADPPLPEGQGRVQLVRLRPDRRSQRRLDPLEIERPIVATLGVGRRPPPRGELAELEIEAISCEPGDGVAEAAAGVAAAAVSPAREAPNQRAPMSRASGERPYAREPPPVEIVRQADEWAALEMAPVLLLVSERAVPDAAGLVEALAAAAPAGTAVAVAEAVPAAVLASCCPELLIKVGWCSAATARSARTRVVLVAPAEVAAAVIDESVDVVWEIAGPDDLTAASLGPLLDALGEPA
jgi:hypothetical protein